MKLREVVVLDQMCCQPAGAVEVFGVGGGGEGGGELGDGEVVEGVFDCFGDGAGVGGGDEAVFEPWYNVSTGDLY